jgi:WhiB family redox-sensing transcriptional regulator
MTQSFRLEAPDPLEELWRLDSAPEPEPRALSWYTPPPPHWEIVGRVELSPGFWIARIKKWLPASVLDGNADLPVALLQVSGHSFSTPAWHLEALCRGHDPALYFGDDKVGSGVQIKVYPSTLRQTKRGCLACPVRRECLTWALDKGEDYGVWGGTSGQDRKAMQELIRTGVTVADLVSAAFDR